MVDTDGADGEPPDYYVDGIQLTVGPFGVGMTFSLAPPHPDPNRPVGPKTSLCPPYEP